MIDNIANTLTDGPSLVFFAFALLAIGGAIFMISFDRVVHMAVAAAFTFLSLAGLYVLLQAEFLAFVQILIYTGAISILMIFGIMMTRHQDGDQGPRNRLQSVLAFVGAAGLFGILFWVIQRTDFNSQPFEPVEDNTKEIGKLLFTEQVIPFELVSLLLTAAFIGAIVLAKREGD
ncbi:NADH-quinone oxidoreductase subunit J [Paenibacillus thermoaerophilus]|uniref:NADH-quinone oxidoreductase subunit J n=1 Tax=Paenibacillus thermoaerophilus TaxID=1215385 RepID=A0ABW2V8F2_9BACL|nr:NADH-quinone oxidoreductase subunit J [Paenibacillus thermoaerophilus]TMV12491.1 NADH-quinone oxidoreductase subunit J [Paenibacillus thermoaerophilus]